MRTPEQLTLPIPDFSYEQENERRTRRELEQFMENLRSDMIEVRDSTDKSAALANRRHQFLLMGA